MQLSTHEEFILCILLMNVRLNTCNGNVVFRAFPFYSVLVHPIVFVSISRFFFNVSGDTLSHASQFDLVGIWTLFWFLCVMNNASQCILMLPPSHWHKWWVICVSVPVLGVFSISTWTVTMHPTQLYILSSSIAKHSYWECFQLNLSLTCIILVIPWIEVYSSTFSSSISLLKC